MVKCIEPIVSALHTRSYSEAESEQDGTLLDPVAPLLRSTVDEIRRLDGSQAVRSIICSLLSALSRFMDEDICTIVDSPFLLPHLNEVRISDEIADGHSLMLALLHYNESDDASNEENSNISSNGCDLNVSFKALVSADGALSCIPAKSDEDEITSVTESETYSESQSFAYPQDAHILPNHGRATGVYVPLFVVAESTNIKFLMISTLYQRFVLSIDEPLIGIEICNCNPVVRVYLGWLDKTATTVPTVHIAYSSGNVALGRYDLRELSCARDLARVIVGLQTQVQKISLIMRSPRLRNLCWCLSHVGQKAQENYTSKVAHWLLNLPGQHRCPRSSSCPPSLQTLPSGSGNGDRRNRANSLNSPTNKPPLIEDNHTPIDLPVYLSPIEEEDQTFSILKALYLETPRKSRLLDAFLFERDVVFLANLPPDRRLPFGTFPKELLREKEHITAMHNLYSTYSGFAAIKKWTSSDFPLTQFCSESLYPFCNTLAEQNRKYCGELDTPAFLDEDLVTFIEQKLDIILLPSCYFSSVINNEKNEPIFYRHLWDYFLAAFCQSDSSIVDRTNICFDVKVHTSRNRHADILQDILLGGDEQTVADLKARMQDLSRDMLTRCVTNAIASKDRIVQLAASIAFETHSLNNSVCQLDDHIFSEMILQRAQTEPLEGLCDIIALRPAIFRAPHADPKRVSCPPDCSFIMSGNETLQETGPPHDIPESFRVSHKRYHGHCPENYELQWSPGGILSPPTEMRTPVSSASVSPRSSSVPPTYSNGPYMLPFIVAICQERFEAYWSASQRLSIHLTTAVDIYAHLGIKDYVVWGLLIGGARCGIFMAWRSSVNDRTYVVQRATRIYDISIPYEALQFALFLLRVRESQRTLLCSDLILSEVRNSADSSLSVKNQDDFHVVLTMDPNCEDSEGKWSSWMKAKQHLDVPCTCPELWESLMSLSDSPS